jgi:hypothetical protein
VNANPAESQLDPMSPLEMATVLGEGKFAVARSADELREVMGDVRIGRELFPWLMTLLVLLFAAEHLLANRFYRNVDRAESSVQRVRTSSSSVAKPTTQSSTLGTQRSTPGTQRSTLNA